MYSTFNALRDAFLSMTRLSGADPPGLGWGKKRGGRHSDIAISKGEWGMGMRNPPVPNQGRGFSPAW